jgi:hypothetical protein
MTSYPAGPSACATSSADLLPGTLALELIGILLPKLAAPLSRRLGGHRDARCKQELFKDDDVHLWREVWEWALQCLPIQVAPSAIPGLIVECLHHLQDGAEIL